MALVDLVDRILAKGAVVRGQLILSVADLHLLLGAVDTLERSRPE